MAEYIVVLPNGGAAEEHFRLFVGKKMLYSYEIAEQIVRCCDCENGHKAHYRGRTIIDCHGPLVQTWDYWQDEPLVNEVTPDGFCAWGVRRAE